MREDDALRALEAGASGIVVSNHGGRQLDHCVPTVLKKVFDNLKLIQIEALPEVVKAVNGQIPVRTFD